MRRACVRMSSSRVFRSRSVPRATPMRVNSPISRLRFAASARARAVSSRAAASRYPARTATSSCRGPTGCFTKPESSSDGISAGRSGSPSRPSATIAPPASTNARSASTGKIARRGARRRVAPDVTSRVLHALEALLRLGVLREDGQRPLVHLRGLVLLPAILEQERLRIERQRLRRDLTVAPLVRGLSRERRQVGVLHQPSGHGPNDVEQVVPLHAIRLYFDDLARLHVHQPRVQPEVTVEIDERTGDDLLQCVEILLVLPVRAAVVERQHGDARSSILATALGAQVTSDEAEQRE